MKKKKVLFGGIAIALSTIMFSRTVPMEVWNAMAEEIKEALSSEETVETDETVSANTLTDENNLNGYILEEDVSKRTRTTKEYVMSDETRMIQQFAAPVHEYINGESTMDKLPINYYSQPWEYEADKLGGVDRGVPVVPISFWDLPKLF